jgi:CrcB protein
MLVKNLLLVGAGGFLGSMFRYALGLLLKSNIFPLATFLINISGSFFIGLIIGYSLKNSGFDNNYRLFLATGFCGGFTTFSAFAYENLTLLKSGHFGYFFLYAFGSLAIGIFATYLGLLFTK